MGQECCWLFERYPGPFGTKGYYHSSLTVANGVVTKGDKAGFAKVFGRSKRADCVDREDTAPGEVLSLREAAFTRTPIDSGSMIATLYERPHFF